MQGAVALVGAWGRKVLYWLHICKFYTGIVTCEVDNIFIYFTRRSPFKVQATRAFQNFFLPSLYHSYQWSPDLRWESAGCERSTSRMAKCSAGVNSDFENGFFWKSVTLNMQIMYRFRSMDLWPQEMFMFWKCIQMVLYWSRTLSLVHEESQRERFWMQTHYKKDSLLASISNPAKDGRSLPRARGASVDLPESITVSAPYRKPEGDFLCVNWRPAKLHTKGSLFIALALSRIRFWGKTDFHPSLKLETTTHWGVSDLPPCWVNVSNGYT